ncbi:MAG: hypothetical protein ACFE0P_12015 [Oceanicaulis sp.]
MERAPQACAPDVCAQRRPHRSGRPAEAGEAGEPVSLDSAFFLARDAGGVGREPVVMARSYRVLWVGDRGAPRSAGREAARRGLGRETD